MKQLKILLLLSLVLLPVIWNGISVFHHLVEHTHTFCQDPSDHTHTTAEDCLTICKITPNHQHQIPTHNDYQELKQYLTPNLPYNTHSNSISLQMNFEEPHLSGYYFSDDIFHPPIGWVVRCYWSIYGLLSYHLNKKIKELRHRLNNYFMEEISISGKIYNRQETAFTDLYPELICMEHASLN